MLSVQHMLFYMENNLLDRRTIGPQRIGSSDNRFLANEQAYIFLNLSK